MPKVLISIDIGFNYDLYFVSNEYIACFKKLRMKQNLFCRRQMAEVSDALLSTECCSSLSKTDKRELITVFVWIYNY